MITEENMDLNIREFDEPLYKKIRAIIAFQGAKGIKEWVTNTLRNAVVDYEKHNGNLDPHLESNNEET
jgi:hypothetical protein